MNAMSDPPTQEGSGIGEPVADSTTMRTKLPADLTSARLAIGVGAGRLGFGTRVYSDPRSGQRTAALRAPRHIHWRPDARAA
jgi:hypothetical protein